ncbi:MAG TPA: biliverdin-producing heme oxygenase, partial [Nannocystis sp.]
LLGLWAIYDALEAGLQRHAGHPVAGPLALPELYRSPAIAADLGDLFDLTPGARPIVPAAVAYAERLYRLADAAPSLLVAHAYTRYLGDLSGGQILRLGAARVLGLPAEAPHGTPGLAFYDFPIDDIGAYKQLYRARLDALPVDAGQAAAIIGEARWAFAGTAAVFGELLPDSASFMPHAASHAR